MSLIIKGKTLSPSGIENLAFNRKLLAILVGFALLTLSSYVRVPMYPVPMTMQTLIVLLIGGLYGWRIAGMTLASWLFAGGLGFPISPTASGMVFAHRTNGRLFIRIFASGNDCRLACQSGLGRRAVIFESFRAHNWHSCDFCVWLFMVGKIYRF